MTPPAAQSRAFFADLDVYLARLSKLPKDVKTLARRVVMDSLRRAKVFANRQTRDVLRVKVASVNARIKIRNPATGAAQGSLVFKDRNATQAPALSSFDYSVRKKGGVSVKVRKGESPEVWKHAFVNPNTKARDPDTAQPLIYMRKQLPDGSTAPRAAFVMRGPSVVGLMAERPGFGDSVEQQLADQMQEQAEKRIDKLIEKGF